MTDMPAAAGSGRAPGRAEPGLIHRHDLMAALNRAAQKRVTIIAAPAGTGKTSLLRAWADQPGQDCRIAFMTVRPGQHDMQLFWLSMLGAIRAAAGTGAGCAPLPPVTPGANGSAMADTDSYTLEVGGERVELAWHGPDHSADNIYIHFPDHDTLMFIDVVNAGWIPIYNLNLSDDVIGYTGAPAIALDYPWTHLISGHLGRVATREDVAMHQQYIADIEASSREALASVNPGPLFGHYGENVWAGVSAYLDAVTEHAAAPVIAKYTGVLGGADIEIYTRTTTFAIMQSIRLDRGPSGPVHPLPQCTRAILPWCATWTGFTHTRSRSFHGA